MTGTVKGDDMQVTIVLTDKDETVGDFTLTPWHRRAPHQVPLTRATIAAIN